MTAADPTDKGPDAAGEGDGEPINVLSRPEFPDDVDGIRAVHLAAFTLPDEAALVDRLRADGDLVCSHVALIDEVIVGHVAFSPVALDGEREDPPGVGLAPVAVHPDRQRVGIGRWLIEEGLTILREQGTPYVVVLGDPAYYSRFGFERADELGFGNGYGAGEEFRIAALQPNALDTRSGFVTYAPAFDELTAG